MKSEDGFDQVMDTLGHRYRRRLAGRLLEENPQHAGAVRGHERGASVNETERVHVHLPKLEDAGYITWDRRRGTIEKGPRWEELAPVVELLQAHEDDLPDDCF